MTTDEHRSILTPPEQRAGAFESALEALVLSAHTRGMDARVKPAYNVVFRSEDLWPNNADAAPVHVGMFQSYLERA